MGEERFEDYIERRERNIELANKIERNISAVSNLSDDELRRYNFGELKDPVYNMIEFMCSCPKFTKELDKEKASPFEELGSPYMLEDQIPHRKMKEKTYLTLLNSIGFISTKFLDWYNKQGKEFRIHDYQYQEIMNFSPELRNALDRVDEESA